MVQRAELRAAKASGPYFSLISPRRVAIKSRASSQEAGTNSPSFLISGVLRRFSFWTKSQPKRPLTQRARPLTGLLGLDKTPIIFPSLVQGRNYNPYHRRGRLFWFFGTPSGGLYPAFAFQLRLRWGKRIHTDRRIRSLIPQAPRHRRLLSCC